MSLRVDYCGKTLNVLLNLRICMWIERILWTNNFPLLTIPDSLGEAGEPVWGSLDNLRKIKGSCLQIYT